jgi:D-alanine-D-alanine ligase
MSAGKPVRAGTQGKGRRSGHLRVAGEPGPVAVLKGGGSLEHGVSLRSGARVESALKRLGHRVVGINVGPELVAELLELQPRAAFLALHGSDGEDGTVQGLLETLGIPYTGSGPGACLRCTDKALAKYLMREAAIPTPQFVAFKESAIKDLGIAAALPGLERSIGFPLVVKPARQGSALGVKFARSHEELPAAIVGALSYDRAVVLERYVRGRDLAVSVLACPREGDAQSPSAETGSPIPLPVVEAIPRDEEFYDFGSRYEIGMTTFVCPAELPEGVTERAQELALEVYGLLGCHGYARVDLMLDEASGALEVLETNVVPGLTETSLLPQAADAAGIGFDELVGRILGSAFTR